MRSPAQRAASQKFQASGSCETFPRRRARTPRGDQSIKRIKVATKFDDCNRCIFYCARRTNPACDDCDVGENFEPKVRGMRPETDNDFDGKDGSGDEE